MKKLIIAVAICVAAAISQAAALNWKLSGITETPDAAITAGCIAYWMDASTYDAFMGLESSAVASFCKETYDYSATTTISRGKGTVNSTNGSWTYDKENPETISGYIVVFDAGDASNAKYYANTSVVEKVVPSSGNITAYMDFAANTSGWNEIQSVPEPTSALMLLVGLAGLALKRKVA